MPGIHRTIIALLLLGILGCGGGETSPKSDPEENSTGEGKKQAPVSVPRVDPPPGDLVQAWTGAGATVGRLVVNKWKGLDFDGRKVPQTEDDILAFSFDDFDPVNLDKILAPEVPFALLIDRAEDKYLGVLSRFETLEFLYLPRCKVSDAGLAKIAEIKPLKQLSLLREPLTDPDGKPATITDTGLRSLAGMKQLRKLRIDGYRSVGDSAFSALAGANQLTSLGLVESPTVGTGGLKGLAAFKNLRDLDLSGTGTRDLREAEGLSKLETLRLANCKGVGDAALASVVKLPHLERLDLAYSGVGDAGISKLATLKKLRALAINGCPGVTQASLGPLRKSNPFVLLVK